MILHLFLRPGRRGIFSLFSLAASLFIGFEAPAQVETLMDANSQVTINTSAQTGMNNWTVDGVNVLNQQSFWFRVGPSGGQSAISTLSVADNLLAPNYLQSTYTGNPQFSLQVSYSLVGGANGSGASDLSEQIKVVNLTGAALQYNFFQYADFVAGPDGDTVTLNKNPRGLYNEALVTSPTMTISENVDTALSPGANAGEAAGLGFTLANLTGGTYNLDNNMMSGPGGENTWAFEWEASIPVGGSLLISKDLNVAGVTQPAPEPGAWALGSLGMGLFGLIRHRRNQRP